MTIFDKDCKPGHSTTFSSKKNRDKLLANINKKNRRIVSDDKEIIPENKIYYLYL